MSFFSRNKPKCPVNEEKRLWLENSFIWLLNEFSEKYFLDKAILSPSDSRLVQLADSVEIDLNQVIRIVLEQMDIDFSSVNTFIYDDRPLEIEMGAGYISTKIEASVNYSAGLYGGKNADGTFNIGIERSQLRKLNILIATLAHEAAHIKITGESRIENADEQFIDIVTIFFGFGVFTANSLIYFDQESKKINWQGYSTQQEIAYSLALYTYIRGEGYEPIWYKHLNSEVKSFYDESQLYIMHNKDKVLV